MKMVKQLKQTCASHGPKAPYTIQLVEALAARWMSPCDWKTVAKACLSGGQYVLWRAEYDDIAPKQTNANQNYGSKYIVKSMLTETNEFGALRDHMGLDKITLDQITTCTLAAWRLLPEGKESTSSFSNIKQKPEGPYEDFISRLTEAVHRVISNLEAAGILIKQLEFENANSIYQAILHPMKKLWANRRFHQAMCRCRARNAAGRCQRSSHKREFLSTDSSILFLQTGITHHRVIPVTKAEILACLKLAFPIAKRDTLSAPALKKQLVLIRQILPPWLCLSHFPDVSTNLPRSPCPRCQKGYHWVKDCRSRFHKNITLLVPDQQP